MARDRLWGRQSLGAMSRRQAARRRRGAVIVASSGLVVLVLMITGIVFFARAFSGDGGSSGQTPAASRTEKTKRPAVPIPGWIETLYITPNPYSRPGTALEEVNGVVIHYIGNPGTTADQNRKYFDRLSEQTTESKTYASSHFIIGLEGEIQLIVPLDEIAYASNSRNADTISIECCHPDKTGKFTDATYASLVKLTKWLAETFELDKSQLLRHADVYGKDCPKYFVDNPDKWEAFKHEVMG